MSFGGGETLGLDLFAGVLGDKSSFLTREGVREDFRLRGLKSSEVRGG